MAGISLLLLAAMLCPGQAARIKRSRNRGMLDQLAPQRKGLLGIGCGTCSGCLFGSNGLCYSNIQDKQFCLQWSGNIWCGDGGPAPLPTPAPTYAPTPSPAPTSAPTSPPSPLPTFTPTPIPTSSPSGLINVCYFTNWARYRSGLINIGKDIFEMGLDGDLCTHFMYGFATVTKGWDIKSNDPNADHPSGNAAQDGLCPKPCYDPNFQVNWSNPVGERCQWPCSPTRILRGYEAMTVGMKTKAPNSKAFISVGGWNFNDCRASPADTYGQGSATCEIFSTIAASESRTRTFAANVIRFCRKWGFDGFDIDWEYPVVAGHNSNSQPYQNVQEDYDNYITMLRILKEEFAKEAVATSRAPLLLTAAVGVGKSTAETAYNIPEMNKYLDLINLMTYDLHGAWESRTGCNANLYATQEDIDLGGGVGTGKPVAGYPLSVSWAVDFWIEAGASPSKLTMGVGTYGRGWKLADPSNTTYNAPASGASAPGMCTKQAGYLSYYEIQEMIKSNSATRYYEPNRRCPYIVTKDGQWIGYDDEESLQEKMDFLKTRNLAGTMVWALDLDDFAGRYSNGRKYPLIRLLRQ